MKYNEHSLCNENSTPFSCSIHAPSSTEPLQLRLDRARHLVESLDYAESPLEWQLLLQELRSVLGGLP